MDDIWDKLDKYTKSDCLYSSDEEGYEAYFQQTEHLYISTKNSYTTEAVDSKSLCSEDVEAEHTVVEEKREVTINIHERLLNEMKKSELHCNSERNVQEKIDEMSAEKSQQKEELSEMQHKAQVISKSARMSATDVLSTIVNSETIHHEEGGEMDEYYDRIRSTDTGDGISDQDSRESERKSSPTSSNVDLPNIGPLTTPLNTGVMKSKANVARQGSMKTRRKPTAVKRKSWTPGLGELHLREQDEMNVDENVEEFEQGDTWVTTRTTNEDDGEEQTGSITPSDSSSEDEKEVVKPHLRSGVALPGLGDALKIQMTRSELKRPTALSLAKSAKDSKDNEVTKEDKLDTSPSKPDWMKEVEERKKQPRTSPQRKHKASPGRCSELDTLFEQRKQVHSNEAVDPASLEGTTEASRSKTSPAENIDPELRKMFDKRKNLTPLEVDNDGSIKEPERPKSFHGGQIDSELSKMFEKRKNLTPLDVDEGGVVRDTERPKSFHESQIDPELSKMFEKRKNLRPLDNSTPAGEGIIAKEKERPKSFHGDEADAELNKMFERRKNLRPVEGRATKPDSDDEQVFKPRNVYLQSGQATELDKVFEKRKQLQPVDGVKSHTSEGKFDDSSAVVSSSPDLRQTSGIVRARFHDTKLEPLPGRAEMKVATISEIEVKTARQFQGNRRRVSPESSDSQISRGATSGEHGAHLPHTPTNGAKVAEFVFDGRGASNATVGRIPGNQRGGNAVEQHGKSPDEKRSGTETSGAQVAQFVFDGSAAASHATVGRIPVSGHQRPVQANHTQDHHSARKTSPLNVEGYSGTRGNHVKDEHVVAARAHMIDSHTVHTKQAVISPTASKSGTQSFLEQLSRKPVPGNAPAQGKSVLKPCSGDIPVGRRPTDLKIEQEKLQADSEYPSPWRSYHQQPQPRVDGTPRFKSSSPAEIPPRNLPPINSQSPHSPSLQNSNLRSLPHSLSYPPNSDFSSHPPLKAKTSEPPFTHSPHSPRAPMESRVTSPRAVRVREFKGVLRGGDSGVRDRGERKVGAYTNVGDTRRSVGNTAEKSEFERNRITGNVEVVRSTDGARNVVKQNVPVRLRNGVVTNNANRFSDSFISYGSHSQETMRGRSPNRSNHQKARDVQSSERTDAELFNRVRSPERFGNQRANVTKVRSSDLSGYQNLNRLRSPERTEKLETRGSRNPDRFDNERSRSHERSDGQRITRFDNSRNCQGINRLQSSDNLEGTRLNRLRSPERLNDVGINRVRSPERISEQTVEKVQIRERSNDDRISRLANPGRSEAQIKDNRALREKARDSNESSSSYPAGHDVLNKRNSNGYKIDFNSKQKGTTSDVIPSGIQNDKNFENRTRGMSDPSSLGQRKSILNRESVERAKPVTVTVRSLCESPVYAKSAVIGQIRSHDRNVMTYYEYNGVVNGDVGWRGVKNKKTNLDVQNPESAAIPKWKQELQEKKRLQKERREENTRRKDNIEPQQSGNDMAEWQKRLQGIRKTWGAEENSGESKDHQTMSRDNHVTNSDVDEQNNVPGFLKEFQEKKNK
mgnify:FL=1